MTQENISPWTLNRSNGKPPIALVTGGSRGIGRAIVLALVKAGAKTAFTYSKDKEKALLLSCEAERVGGEAIFFQADACDFARAGEVVREVTEKFGSPTILVNNAGIARDGVIWKMEEKAWDDVIDLNLKGCFNYIRAVSSGMREDKEGKIINITSINGLRGKFGQSNYSASKAGIIGLTKSVARELGASNINVNAVAPGMILTDMFENLPLPIRENARKETLLGRLGLPEDVANVVLFLCSNAAKHITGEVIKVDGGQYL